MNSSVFLSGTAVALTIVLLVVIYLHSHLRRLLAELCGSRERGDFWLAFSNVTLILMTLLFTLDVESVSSDTHMVLAVAAQLRQTLLGLIITLVSIGVVLSLFIARVPAQRMEPPAKG